MKTKTVIFLLLAITASLYPGRAFGQIIIQHSGAVDPVTEGFTLSSAGNVQLGPVFEDLGFNSWVIHSRDHNEGASYHYFLTAGEQQAAMAFGISLSANMRFVEVSDYTRMSMEFQTGTRRFRLIVTATDNGTLLVSGDGIPAFSLETNALDYHHYSIAYEAASNTAALWIDGIEWATDIQGAQITFPAATITFGASGESITYSHWNDVTLAIIPEPTTLPLLLGLGALLFVGVLRWRTRQGRSAG